jgi:hypothetical protein
MYAAETSLIPVGVAAAKFLEIEGLTGFTKIFPYWYGGVPFKYVLGPVVPGLLVFVRHFYGLEYFDISVMIIIGSWIWGGMGWGVLAKVLAKSRKVGAVVFLAVMGCSWIYISGLTLGETSVELSKAVVPWILVFLAKKYRWMAGMLVTLMLLTNTAGLTLLLCGVVVLAVALRFKISDANTDDEASFGFGKEVAYLLKPLLVSLFIAVIWYGPTYFWRLAVNPWIGGLEGVKSIGSLVGVLRNWLPLIFGVGLATRFIKLKDRFAVFGWTWWLSFIIASITRFLANPAFWQDWTYWVPEVFLGGIFITAGEFKKTLAVIACSAIASLILMQALAWRPILNGHIPKGVAALKAVDELCSDQMVFLSGSTVWWANALYPIRQVRGGADRVSLDWGWARDAWELREGESSETSLSILKNREVACVLVHSQNSNQFFRDFKNVEKWQKIGNLVWKQAGDMLYKIN